MDAPSSGLIAEIFLQHIEHIHLAHLTHKRSIINYCRNVDDILLIFNSSHTIIQMIFDDFNRLTPNDPYTGRTLPLTSKRCILHIYSTNIGTEYFKHALYSPFFFSSKCSLFHKANLFGSCITHILYTGCAKIKKIIPAPKG